MPGILIFCMAMFCYPMLGIAADYAPLSPEENRVFESQMQQAIQKAEEYVQQTQKVATDNTRAPMWTDKLQMQNAITQLEVKKTLVNNFVGTESLRSAAVRNKLLSILNQTNISTADLAGLQNLVLQEKQRIQSSNSPASQ